jgi:hypothetical protein
VVFEFRQPAEVNKHGKVKFDKIIALVPISERYEEVMEEGVLKSFSLHEETWIALNDTANVVIRKREDDEEEGVLEICLDDAEKVEYYDSDSDLEEPIRDAQSVHFTAPRQNRELSTSSTGRSRNAQINGATWRYGLNKHVGHWLERGRVIAIDLEKKTCEVLLADKSVEKDLPLTDINLQKYYDKEMEITGVNQEYWLEFEALSRVESFRGC